MNIGDVAARSRVPAKTIRYYESVGLIAAARRTANGYRTYGDVDVQTLRFVRRARSLGFSIEDVADLLALWSDKSRASADVRAVALRQVDRVEDKIRELDSIRRTLLDLIARCHGDERPDCPILEDFAGTTLGGVGERTGKAIGRRRSQEERLQ